MVMSLSKSLKSLVEILDRTHSAGYIYSKEAKSDLCMFDTVISEGGVERHFTAESRLFLHEFSRELYADSLQQYQACIKLTEFIGVVRKAVADLHAADAFANIRVDSKTSVEVLKLRISKAVESASNDYMHHFPAWTSGFEKIKPLKLGPVWIRSRTDWVKSVDFPSNLKASYENNPHANANWQDILIKALNSPKDEQQLTPGLAGGLYSALIECPAVVSVAVRGAEFELSRKLASLVCKCALDCISLQFGQVDFFFQHVLYESRVVPLTFYTIVETDGFLCSPGREIGPRLPINNHITLRNALDKHQTALEAFGSILAAHIDPKTHKHPKLANRWSTALEWFAEGNRESNDSIALAKLGVSLDILSGGGQWHAILSMLTQLTGQNENDEVISGLSPKTLKQLVQDIYNKGRSQILHGNHYMRLKDFTQERRQAMQVGQVALVECAVRLHAYTGEDVDKAFLTMPKP